MKVRALTDQVNLKKGKIYNVYGFKENGVLFLSNFKHVKVDNIVPLIDYKDIMIKREQGLLLTIEDVKKSTSNVVFEDIVCGILYRMRGGYLQLLYDGEFRDTEIYSVPGIQQYFILRKDIEPEKALAPGTRVFAYDLNEKYIEGEIIDTDFNQDYPYKVLCLKDKVIRCFEYCKEDLSIW